MTEIIHHFPSRVDAGRALAGELAALLLDGTGPHVLAMPGGRSPLPLFADLFARDLPWATTTVTLTDERWVPPDSVDSNARQVTAILDRRATFLGLNTAHPTAAEAVPDLARRLAALPALLDAVVLGVGDDGHVASLFPDQPWESAGSPCIAGLAPGAPRERISLTLPRLLATRRLILLFGGALRMDLVSRRPPGLPVSAALEHSPVPIEIYHYDVL